MTRLSIDEAAPPWPPQPPPGPRSHTAQTSGHGHGSNAYAASPRAAAIMTAPSRSSRPRPATAQSLPASPRSLHTDAAEQQAMTGASLAVGERWQLSSLLERERHRASRQAYSVMQQSVLAMNMKSKNNNGFMDGPSTSSSSIKMLDPLMRRQEVWSWSRITSPRDAAATGEAWGNPQRQHVLRIMSEAADGLERDNDALRDELHGVRLAHREQVAQLDAELSHERSAHLHCANELTRARQELAKAHSARLEAEARLQRGRAEDLVRLKVMRTDEAGLEAAAEAARLAYERELAHRAAALAGVKQALGVEKAEVARLSALLAQLRERADDEVMELERGIKTLSDELRKEEADAVFEAGEARARLADAIATSKAAIKARDDALAKARVEAMSLRAQLWAETARSGEERRLLAGSLRETEAEMAALAAAAREREARMKRQGQASSLLMGARASKSKVDDKSDELEALRRMIAELQDKLADAAALAVKVQLEHEAALERQSAAFQRAKAAREREWEERLEEVVRQKDAEMADLLAEVEKLRKQVTRLQRMNKEKEAEKAELSRQIDEHKDEIFMLKGKFAKLF